MAAVRYKRRRRKLDRVASKQVIQETMPSRPGLAPSGLSRRNSLPRVRRGQMTEHLLKDQPLGLRARTGAAAPALFENCRATFAAIDYLNPDRSSESGLRQDRLGTPTAPSRGGQPRQIRMVAQLRADSAESGPYRG
jgi:hypothetical protein